MPRDVCFMTAASWCPVPISAVELGKEAVARKSRPWELSSDMQQQQCEGARNAAAALIGANPSDMAIIPSVGYGVASAAKILGLEPGASVIVLADDHTSPVLEWSDPTGNGNLKVHTVQRGLDGDWTSAVLEKMAQVSKSGLALVSISNVHWADGGLIDMDAVASAARNYETKVLLDATHAVGVVDVDVNRIQPDFLIFPTYKWLLGPYGRAFLYVAPQHHGGIPLEQTMSGRKRVRAEDPVYFSDLSYVEDASRFDMGERDFFISLDLARHGMELVHRLGRASVEARLKKMTTLIETEILEAELPVDMLSEQHRSPNILSLRFPQGMPDELEKRLAAHKVYAAVRLGHLRIAPHIYNDEEDCEKLVAALYSVIKEAR